MGVIRGGVGVRGQLPPTKSFKKEIKPRRKKGGKGKKIKEKGGKRKQGKKGHVPSTVKKKKLDFLVDMSTIRARGSSPLQLKKSTVFRQNVKHIQHALNILFVKAIFL